MCVRGGRGPGVGSGGLWVGGVDWEWSLGMFAMEQWLRLLIWGSEIMGLNPARCTISILCTSGNIGHVYAVGHGIDPRLSVK